jgi:glutaredoxin
MGSNVPTFSQDLRHQEIAERAAQHGVRSVPAVVIDGKPAGCSANRGVGENVLREALS